MKKEEKQKKQVLVVLGSPRKRGNSATLAERIARGAQTAGALVELVFLSDLSIAPCRSCYACQKKGAKGCAIQDDMQLLYPKLISAHAWVLASPVYWFNMSAQMKMFMDRLFAFPAYDKKAFTGKRIAIAMTYGDVDPFASGCVNALRCFQDAFSYTGSEIVGMIYGSALKAGDIEKNQDLLKEAEKLGRKLISK
ncbi:MAG: flavodoxin family protein [Syntrophales bacterium]|nr:flavodoxin family protein [Syntrophales bacterium]